VKGGCVEVGERISEVFAAALDVAFPRRCAACGAPVRDRPGYLCWDCFVQIPMIVPPFCRTCGDPMDGAVDMACDCHACLTRKPSFDLARSAARYRGPLKDIIHRFKYSVATFVAADLVALLEACVRTHFAACEIDAVASVPLHCVRERERTYNQSGILAVRLARRLGWPLAARAVVRRRPTATQTTFSAAERRANVRDAFEPRHLEWLEGRRILLVDDVMTTGATVDECARALKDGGAARVYVVTVARG
jgi:ComF family protein